MPSGIYALFEFNSSSFAGQNEISNYKHEYAVKKTSSISI